MLKCNHLDRPTPVAIALGTDPSIGLCSVAKIPYGVDELAVAGALRGEPVPVVRAKTVDLMVPATAEIVIEGFIRKNELEWEGPFGEFTGYMGPHSESYVLDVTAITHRHKPIFQAFLSQMPPSESSTIRGFGREAAIRRHLLDLKLPVKDVHLLRRRRANTSPFRSRRNIRGRPSKRCSVPGRWIRRWANLPSSSMTTLMSATRS
jgi:UbiD family decarboxylase